QSPHQSEGTKHIRGRAIRAHAHGFPDCPVGTQSVSASASNIGLELSSSLPNDLRSAGHRASLGVYSMAPMPPRVPFSLSTPCIPTMSPPSKDSLRSTPNLPPMAGLS